MGKYERHSRLGGLAGTVGASATRLDHAKAWKVLHNVHEDDSIYAVQALYKPSTSHKDLGISLTAVGCFASFPIFLRMAVLACLDR